MHSPSDASVWAYPPRRALGTTVPLCPANAILSHLASPSLARRPLSIHDVFRFPTVGEPPQRAARSFHPGEGFPPLVRADWYIHHTHQDSGIGIGRGREDVQPKACRIPGANGGTVGTLASPSATDPEGGGGNSGGQGAINTVVGPWTGLVGAFPLAASAPFISNIPIPSFRGQRSSPSGFGNCRTVGANGAPVGGKGCGGSCADGRDVG